jgi:hypothetical protein
MRSRGAALIPWLRPAAEPAQTRYARPF